MIILGLGSNQGDREANFHEAISMMERRGVKTLRKSSFYQTEPWGRKNQPDFLNAVIEVSFDGTAHELLKIVLGVEQLMGRVRNERWGPRLIDLDILEFKGQQIEEPGLSIPHPYYPKRMFVLTPLAELEPDWVPTGMNKTVKDLLSSLQEEV